jgi:putative ABC transport system permease protein
LIKNYLKIALRNLLKFKAYSFINIFGLAIGIAACMMILLYIRDELSYDKYNAKADQIYRIHTFGKLAGNEINIAVSPPPLGETLVRDYPEVVQYTRLLPNKTMLIRYKDNVFNESNFFWADSTVFDVFTIPFIEGDPKTALNQPHTVVLTEKLAKKYFGKEDPMDKIMKFEDGTPYTVKGVVQNCPPNAHFHYDIFASIASLGLGDTPYWISNNFYTYIVLRKGVPGSELEAKLPGFAEKYAGPQLKELFGASWEELRKSDNIYEFHMQPLTDIHLNSHLDYELEPNSDIKYVYIFSIIALFILLIACINFMNLSTARSAVRSKEVGIRKVLGSNKTQLVKQFLSESILLTFIAVVIAIALVEIFLPSFNTLAGKDLHTSYFNNFITIPVLVLVVIIVGLIAGSYPAFFLSSFRPVTVLKGNLNHIGGSWLRSGLVVFQFAISIILFIGTFIIYGQLKYVQDKNLGFDREHVLVVTRAWALENQSQTFKNELMNNTHIVSASNTDNLPGRLFGQTVFKPEDSQSPQQYILAIMSTDYDFAKTMKLKLAEGRYFSREHASDSLTVVINESAAKLMGIKDPVGKRVILQGRTNDESMVFTVIGVLKDFNFESLHQKIRPLAIFLNKGQTAYLPVRIRPADVAGSVSFVEKEWKKFVPNKPFEYFFLDEDFNKLYQSEQKTGEIFSVFSVLAIFIACLGLFGLAAFTAERRTKEIGIRKVLGASIPGIVILLSKEFTKWVLVANIIAWPLAYYFMNNWLQNFAYRIDPGWGTFLLSAVIALFIALLTVSFQAIKVAVANPVNALRNE